MTDVPLFELAPNDRNGNKERGHIALIPSGGRVADAYFVDVGDSLQWWTYSGGRITPDTARELGRELIEWADRKQPRERDN